jgi:hypothetical protein
MGLSLSNISNTGGGMNNSTIPQPLHQNTLHYAPSAMLDDDHSIIGSDLEGSYTQSNVLPMLLTQSQNSMNITGSTGSGNSNNAIGSTGNHSPKHYPQNNPAFGLVQNNSWRSMASSMQSSTSTGNGIIGPDGRANGLLNQNGGSQGQSGQNLPGSFHNSTIIDPRTQRLSFHVGVAGGNPF